MFQFLKLAGSPDEIGRQHGQQIRHLRPLLVQVVDARLAELRYLGAAPAHVLEPARAALETHDRSLLEFLAGLGQVLQFSADTLLLYTLSSYLRDLFKVSLPLPPIAATLRDGCTTWAASHGSTPDGAPVLAKNRDYHQDHIPLQHLCHVEPEQGYRYLGIGSSGSPYVFSSGINECGLAIADTHVLSTDIGPGLPRFSLMREVLEHHATTASALDYLRAVSHMGAGTLMLADARGHLAVCESGRSRCGYLEAGASPDDDTPAYLASTNHFVTSELAAAWVEDEPLLLQGNSPARRERVLAGLAGAAGQVDLGWAQAMMSAHGTLQNAICRHEHIPADQPLDARFGGSTISAAIYLPRGLPGEPTATPAVWLASGQPCAAQWECHLLDTGV